MFKLPTSIQEIGEEAFAGCASLTGGITNVRELGKIQLGKRAFAGTSLGMDHIREDAQATAGSEANGE